MLDVFQKISPAIVHTPSNVFPKRSNLEILIFHNCRPTRKLGVVKSVRQVKIWWKLISLKVEIFLLVQAESLLR